jgi:CheY-like chemotaxis protein
MQNLKVLIVEDEVLIAMQLMMGLKRAGYSVCQLVTTGEDAIECVRDENPDVVVMDIRLMGVMDGIEAAQRIRGIASPIIIFTTGYQDHTLRERALAVTPAAYLSKPVSWSDVHAVIERSG